MAYETLLEIRVYEGLRSGEATTIIGLNDAIDSADSAAVCAYIAESGHLVTMLSAAEFCGNANFNSMNYLEVQPPLKATDLHAFGRFCLENTGAECLDVIDNRSQPPWLPRPPKIIAQRRRETVDVCVELLGA